MEDWRKGVVSVDDELLKRAFDRQSFVESEKENTPDNILLRNARGVGLGIATDIAAPVARALGQDQFAEDTHLLDEATNQVLAEKEADNYIPDVLERGARSAARTVPQVMAMGRAGGMKGILGGVGVQTYERAYSQAIDQGADEGQAHEFAGQQTAIEVGVTAAFNRFAPGMEGYFAKSMSKDAAQAATKGFRQSAIDFAKMTGAELPEEELVSFLQKGSEKFSSLDQKEWTADEAYELALETASATLFSTGLTQGVDAVSGRIGDQMERKRRFDEIKAMRAQRGDVVTTDEPAVSPKQEAPAEPSTPTEEPAAGDPTSQEPAATQAGQTVEEQARILASLDVSPDDIASMTPEQIAALTAIESPVPLTEADASKKEGDPNGEETNDAQADEQRRQEEAQRLLESDTPVEPERIETEQPDVVDDGGEATESVQGSQAPLPTSTNLSELSPADVEAAWRARFPERGRAPSKSEMISELDAIPSDPPQETPADENIESLPTEQEPAEIAPKVDDEEYFEGKTEGYKPLPKKTKAAFESALNSDNADDLSAILHQENKNLRAEFTERTGVQLPRTNKGTRVAIEDWIAGGKKNETPTKAGPEPTAKPKKPRKLGSDKKKPESKPEPKLIGKNAAGQEIYEDSIGVRSIADGNVMIGEAVTLKPIRDPNGAVKWVGDTVNREDRFKTVEEMPQTTEATPVVTTPVVSDKTPEIDVVAESPGARKQRSVGMVEQGAFKTGDRVSYTPNGERNLAKPVTGVITGEYTGAPKSGRYGIKGDDGNVVYRLAVDLKRVDETAPAETGQLVTVTSSETKNPAKDDVSEKPAAKKLTREEKIALVEAGMKSVDAAPEQAVAEPKKPRTLGSEKTIKERIVEKKEAAEESLAEKQTKLANKFKDMGLFSGVDPRMAELIPLMADYMVTGITVKGWQFAELVASFADEIGATNIPKVRKYLEAGWNIIAPIEDAPIPDYDEVFAKYEPTQEQDDDTDGRSEASSGEPGDGGTNADGQGDAGLLATIPTDDVSPAETGGDTGGTGDAAGGPADTGNETTGDGRGNVGERSEPADDGGVPADDTGVGRDPRDESDPEKARRPETTTRPNYFLADPAVIVGGGPKAKFARNRKAIQVVQELEGANREPTKEELDTLAGYTGWGAFGQELFQGTWKEPKVKKGWEDENEWLREHLGETDWESARESIINAHYTSPPQVEFVWNLMRRMGFAGGRLLEPSMGNGNFFSMMPRDLMGASSLVGIELDRITARMAKILHPQANISQKGYQDSKTGSNFYDSMVGNVPFSQYDKITDAKYEGTYALHNYFFRKGLDQLKPGGVMAFITSSKTMDGKSSAKKLRRIIEKEADLVAAYRFPSGAFKEYAGTGVVADLIVIRKRHPGELPQGKLWNEIIEMDTPAGEKIEVNEYWQQHPENVFGTLNFGSGSTFGAPSMIVDPTGNIDEMMANAVEKIPAGIIDTKMKPGELFIKPNDTGQRQNTVVIQDDEVMAVEGEHLVPVKFHAVNAKQKTIDARKKEIKNLLPVREALREIFNVESSGKDANEARKVLVKAYDDFVSKHGYISKSNAIDVLLKARDPLGNAVLELESKNVDGTYSKRPIFTRTTVRGKTKIEKPTVLDAYALQRSGSLVLDIDEIAKLANATPEQVVAELEASNTIYKTANGNYEPADIFLSGNVLRKHRELEEAIEVGVDGLEKSRDAIAKVLPPIVPYSDIEAKLGATWVTSEDYRQFLSDIIGEELSEFRVDRLPNKWRVRLSNRAGSTTQARQTFGTSEVPFWRIANAAFNSGTLTVRTKDDEGILRYDEDATERANAKVQELKEEFQGWIWSNQDRIARLSVSYNEMFNAHVQSKFTETPLTFEGLALHRGDTEFSLRIHQEAAVWRGVVNGKGIYGHEVGTGKTYTMGALAMESRRLGLVKKPMLFAHNANSMSVKNDIQAAYPNARILYVDNLNAQERDRTLAAIALDDWDLVVVPHSLVDKFQLKPETLESLLREQLESLEAEAREAFEASDSNFKGSFPTNLRDITDDAMKELKEPTAKDLVKEIKKLRSQIAKAAQASSDANTVFFEDMGIDMMMVDEAHVFKKIPIASQQNLKGFNKTGSKELGIPMLLLTDYIRNANNGKGVHMFTGTPLTNTLNEIYTMMRLVMPEEMAQVGVKEWDGWFNMFANSESNLELSSGGTFEMVERLTSFVNLPELRKLVGQFMDTVFADDMKEFVDRETREGRTEDPKGRPYKQVLNEVVEMSEFSKRASEDLKERYLRFKNASKRERREIMKNPRYIHLRPVTIDGEGRKLALDPRLLDITADVDPKDPSLKINKMLRNALGLYNENEGSTQMIFTDLGHSDWVERTRTQPDGTKVKTRHRVFNVAKEIKRRLIEEGVSESEIAIFSEVSDKAKRAELAEKMQRGEIRFAIGSTSTMGTGVNAQNEMIAMHHLDAPWMPGELEQRNGRGHRQGNHWNTVFEYRYLTEGPQEGRRWQVLLTKDRFIRAFMRGRADIRTIDMEGMDLSDSADESEDTGGEDIESTLSSAAGDPRLMLRAKLDKDIAQLEKQRTRHGQNVNSTVTAARRKSADLVALRRSVQEMTVDSEQFKSFNGKPFEMVIGDKTFTSREEANNALDEALGDYTRKSVGRRTEIMPIGSYRGMRIVGHMGALEVRGEMTHDIRLPSAESIDGTLRALSNRVEKTQEEIRKAEVFIKQADELIGRPFNKQAQLDRKKKQLAELLDEMNRHQEPSPAWLRAGAPVGTSVYHKGTEYEVAGHRGEDTILVNAGKDAAETMIALPADELTDSQGTPVFVELWNQRLKDNMPAPPLASSRPMRQQRGRRLGRKGRRGTSVSRASQFNPSEPRSPRSSSLNPKQAPIDANAEVKLDNSTPGAPVTSADDDKAGISAADINATLDRLFNVTTRIGDVRGRALGEYMGLSATENAPRVVRLAERAATSIAVKIHEIGHHIDRVTGIVSAKPGLIRGTLSNALRSELKNLDYSPQGRTEEGFAEFLRIYLTEPNTMDVNGNAVTGPLAKAPKFNQYFENEFLPAHPEIAKAITESKKYIRQYADQSLFRKMGAMIGQGGRDLSTGERLKQRMLSGMRSFETKILDDTTRLNDFDKAYIAMGGDPDRPSARNTFLHYKYSAHDHAARALTYGVHDVATNKRIGKPFWSRMKDLLKTDSEIKDVQVYAWARHTIWSAQVRPRYNTGMSLADARRIVDQVKQDSDQYKRFEKASVLLSDTFRDALRMRMMAGALSTKDYKTIEDYYGDNYFPLSRVMNNENSIPYKGSSFNSLLNPKGLRGRTKQGSGRGVIDVFDQLQQQMIDHYTMAAKSRVMAEMREMADPRFGGAEGMGAFMVAMPPSKELTKIQLTDALQQLIDIGLVEADDANAALTAGMILGTIPAVPTPAELDEFAIRHNISSSDAQAMADAALTEPDISVDLRLWKPVIRADKGKAIATLYDDDGNELLYQFDEKLYTFLSGLADEHLKLSTPTTRFLQQTFKKLAAGLQITFGQKNIITDFQSYQRRAKNVRGLRSLSEPIKETLGYAYKGFRRRLLGRSADKIPSLYVLFDQMGGASMSAIGSTKQSMKAATAENLSKSFWRRIGFVGSGARGIFAPVVFPTKKFLDFVEGVIQISDVGPRLAEMRARIKELGYTELTGDKWLETATGRVVRGLPEHVIISGSTAASNATINFKPGGEISKEIDIVMPFFRATINSQVTHAKDIINLRNVLNTKDPEAMRMAQRYMVVLGSTVSMAAMLYALRKAMDEEDEYKNADEDLLDRYWLMPGGLGIPKSRDEAIIANITEIVIDDLYGDVEPRKLKEMIYNDLTGRVPTGGGIARGVIELMMNEDIYRNRPIESQSMQSRSTEYQYDDRTMPASVLLGKATQYVGLSPVQVEHLLNSVTANEYRKMGQRYNAITQGEYEKLVPGSTAFNRPWQLHRPISDMYDKIDELDTKLSNAKFLGDKSKELDDTRAELAKLKDYSELRSTINKAMYEDKSNREEYEKFMVGAAREALGYERVDSTPSPITADPAEMPPAVLAAVKDFVKTRAGDAIKVGGVPSVVPVTAPEGTTLEDIRKQYRSAIDARLDYLEEHKNDPIVTEYLESTFTDPKYNKSMYNRKYNPGDKDFVLRGQSFQDDRAKDMEQVARVRKLREEIIKNRPESRRLGSRRPAVAN